MKIQGVYFKGGELMPVDHSYFISSFHAVKVDPDTGQQMPYTADESGVITVEAGDVIQFPHYQDEGFVPINALTLHAVTSDLKVALNGNTEHPAFVPAGASLGISSMAIYSLTILDPCSFRYEGLAM